MTWTYNRTQKYVACSQMYSISLYTHTHTNSLAAMATNHLKLSPASGTKVKSLK